MQRDTNADFWSTMEEKTERVIQRKPAMPLQRN